jgi:hypothetical protein
MPNHRRSEELPQKLISTIRASSEHDLFGRIHTIIGGGLKGARVALHKKERFKPVDIQYAFNNHVITRTEFIRGMPSIPIHIAHFDPESGKRLGISLDLS